ncbi:SGNH/GDSL hydrolase family protein [Paraburkholderia jirisanensis]
MHQVPQFRKMIRLAQVAIAIGASVALVACGGSDHSSTQTDANNPPAALPPGGVKLQVVSFGDSLSDVGTYAPVASQFGGGRYTTNPGQNWTQLVATYYGDTLTAAQTGGFGGAPVDNPNGYSYAQGGAIVEGTDGSGGIGWLPNNAGPLTIPVQQQLSNYFTAHGHAFNANQLVLVEGGANDILKALSALSAPQEEVRSSASTQRVALAASTVALPPATVQALQAAVSQQIENITNIIAAGAQHVVVVNVPDLAATPYISTLPASQQAVAGLLTPLAVEAFNDGLKTGLNSAHMLEHVVFIDAQTWLDGEVANAPALGFKVSNTDTACDLTKMASQAPAPFNASPATAQAFASSLFCSAPWFKEDGADQSYMFADTVHPTTKLYALFAQYVQQQIAAAGLGK